jgi:hypothetical protein
MEFNADVKKWHGGRGILMTRLGIENSETLVEKLQRSILKSKKPAKSL